MKKNLWIMLSTIVIIVTLSIFIVLPQSPFWGNQIKAMLGLDLVGGTELVYEADLSKSIDKAKDLTNLSNIFRKRIDELGVSEPTIQTTGNDRIIIELPGIKDINTAISRIGQTYDLVFMTESTDGVGVQMKDYYDPTYTYPGYWIKTDLTGSNLIKADYTFEGGAKTVNTQPVVTIKFDNVGKEKFQAITKNNINKRIAIVLDNKIVSAPNVQVEITDGSAIITGSKDLKEAQELSRRLNEGILPVPAKLIGQQNVGATLGQDSLKKSMVAGIIGLFLVGLFMLIHYRIPGIIATFSLVIYSLVALALFKLIPVTLSLAGIAGFILSIGMAIDANILIFERMREEIRSGKEISLSIKDGFKRSWSSIRDSNFSSLITCVILYIFAGSGPVRGFALTLGVGILVSLFTAITVTRTILLIIASTKARRVLNV